jgi:starvation-inducible DNA-binding protein
MKIEIGLDEATRKKIADGLSKLLADSYTLYLKTHNYHWNVTGPMFQTLHELFEKQYLDLADAVDVIAERIRALGFLAPASYTQFLSLTTIKEPQSTLKALDMVIDLVSGQEEIVKTARGLIELVEEVYDEPTADLLTQRMQVHEKNAWMLRSILES